MSDENGFEPINVLLSREELIFVLDLLQAILFQAWMLIRWVI